MVCTQSNASGWNGGSSVRSGVTGPEDGSEEDGEEAVGWEMECGASNGEDSAFHWDATTCRGDARGWNGGIDSGSWIAGSSSDVLGKAGVCTF
jgi:hypothetical protein